MKNENNMNIIPVKSYLNAKINKEKIIKDNRGKCGIYRWTNLINSKSYIGSAIDLGNRLNMYYHLFTLEKLLTRGNSAIYRAILKYDHSNFSLDILEYCEPKLLITREQYYIDLLKPKYNILKTAGSKFGHRSSEETKFKLSMANRGNKNYMFGKNHTEETKKKLSESIKLYKKFNKTTDETKLKMSLRCKGIKIKIFDNSGNLVKEFPTLKAAAIYFNMHAKTMSRVVEKNLPYYGFTFKFEINNTRIWVHNNNNKLIKIFDTIVATSKELNIPCTTLSRYVQSNKLYKNKFYFYKNKVTPTTLAGISNDEFTYKFELKDLRIWICDPSNKLIEVLQNIKTTSDKYDIPYRTLQRYIKLGKLYKNKFYFYKNKITN